MVQIVTKISLLFHTLGYYRVQLLEPQLYKFTLNYLVDQETYLKFK